MGSVEDAHVIVAYDFGDANGGAGRIAIDTAIGLARTGVRVTYLCAVGPVNSDLSAAGVEVVCLDQADFITHRNRLAAMAQVVWNRRAADACRRIVAGSPHRNIILHLHGWGYALSPSFLVGLPRERVTTVLTLHDYFLSCPNGLYFDFRKNAPCTLKPLSIGCLTRHCEKRSYGVKLWKYVRKASDNWLVGVVERLDHIFAVSEFSVGVLRRITDHLPPVTVVPNPIETPEGSRVEAERNRAFVIAGRATVEKGVGVFARCTHNLGVPRVVIGEAAMARQIATIDPGLEVTGWLSREEFSAQLERARVLVFPSLWYETFGLTVAEALGRGLPVIASANSGAASWVADGEDGFLVDPSDEDRLEELMRTLASDDALVRRMSERAFARFHARPRGLDVYVALLLQSYADVLRRRNLLAPSDPSPKAVENAAL